MLSEYCDSMDKIYTVALRMLFLPEEKALNKPCESFTGDEIRETFSKSNYFKYGFVSRGMSELNDFRKCVEATGDCKTTWREDDLDYRRVDLSSAYRRVFSPTPEALDVDLIKPVYEAVTFLYAAPAIVMAWAGISDDDARKVKRENVLISPDKSKAKIEITGKQTYVIEGGDLVKYIDEAMKIDSMGVNRDTRNRIVLDSPYLLRKYKVGRSKDDMITLLTLRNNLSRCGTRIGRSVSYEAIQYNGALYRAAKMVEDGHSPEEAVMRCLRLTTMRWFDCAVEDLNCFMSAWK